LDNNGFKDWDEGGRIYVIKGKDEKLWDMPWSGDDWGS
jgi:hypothetical protein